MKKLTLSKAKEIVKGFFGIPAYKLRESEDCKGIYKMELGEMYIAVSDSRPFGTHNGGEYIKVVVGMLPDSHMDFLFDSETLERDFIAEEEMKDFIAQCVIPD